MIVDFVHGAALLLALSFFYLVVLERGPRQPLQRALASGLLFGLIAVVGMVSPIVIAEGVILDARSVILAMAGLFGGPVAATLAAAIAGGYRLALGGAGAPVGVAIIVTSALMGLAYRVAVQRRLIGISVPLLVAFGLAVHLACVGWLLLLPGELARRVIDTVALPYAVVFAVATACTGLLLREIEDMAEARRALALGERRLRDLIEHVAVSLWVVDLSRLDAALDRLAQQGVTDIRHHLTDNPDAVTRLIRLVEVQDVNPAALTLFEADAKDRLVGAIVPVPGTGLADTFVEIVAAIWLGARSFRAETRLTTLTGRPITCIVSVPLPEGAEARRRVPVSIVDISDRRRAEEAIVAAKAQAERANRAKSEFVAAMSHDLRTPLNAIMGFAEMMRSECFGPLGDRRYRDYAGDIFDSGKLLLSVVDDVLDLSKVESGRFVLHEEACDLVEVANATLTQLARAAADKHQTLAFTPPEPPPRVDGDRRILQQVLNNLLSNAVKFSAEGTTIRLALKRRADGGTEMVVADKGIGMSPADIEKAIRPFEQADSKYARPHQGTGLGLFLSLSFMRLHGGDLTIDSTPGEGTTVTARLPPERSVD